MSQYFTFKTVLNKIKRQNFLKKQNALFWGFVGSNTSKIEISGSIRLSFCR